MAGWSLPASVRARFPNGESILARYAQVFPMVEINSSFYRPHQPKTYERWAAATPDTFSFAVKMPRAVTHEARLMNADAPLIRLLGAIEHLGDKLGPVLIQLSPSLAFDARIGETFLTAFRAIFSGETALEPRHASWFTEAATRLLIDHQIARVAADPAIMPMAAEPGGWEGFSYWRLHGSPRLYATPCDEARLTALSRKLRPPSYVVFDNTMLLAATGDALALMSMLS